MEDLVLTALIQLLVTWVLVGVIWFSQIIHYPLYNKIKEGFVEYERAHIRRAAYLIAPLMFIEVISAVLLSGLAEGELLSRLAMINLIFLILIWISTFLFQVTQHQKLSVRFSKKIIHNLIASNWIRTLLWTAKGVVMTLFIYYLLLEHIA